ncbi:MAG TPA: hypothetical protein VHG08_03610 [Longimicrobium sp.]|nr:hypothetical protein [Longimicrobium sp.]
MKAALTFCFLALFAAKSCDAQQARAQVAASVMIVEAIGVTMGATEVTPSTTGVLDVTTPLSIRGAVPRVVQVLDGVVPRPISQQLQPTCTDADHADAGQDACAVRSRLRASDAAKEGTVLTYQIATVN